MALALLLPQHDKLHYVSSHVILSFLQPNEYIEFTYIFFILDLWEIEVHQPYSESKRKS